MLKEAANTVQKVNLALKLGCYSSCRVVTHKTLREHMGT